MAKDNQPAISAGDGSVNTIGDGNNVSTYIVQSAPKPIKRSYLYDVSKIIVDASIPASEDYSLAFNAEWQKKLEYNSISPQYVEILTGEAYAYDVVSEIMEDFPKRETLVRKIHNIYLAKEKERSQEGKDGDYVLQEVFKELEKIFIDCESSLTEHMPNEERDRCIWLLMFYTFTKCQLLKKPA